MMVAPVAAAKVGSRTRSVWSSSPPLRWNNGNKGGRGVKAEAMMRAIAIATRVASYDNSNGNGGKSDGNGDKGGRQATTRVIMVSTTVVDDNEGNGDGDEGGERQRG
jgi:hypothetical protein